MAYINWILLFRTQLLTVFLHGSEKYAFNVNKEIIRLLNSYLKASKCFVQPLFYQQHLSLFIYLFIFIFIF